MADKKPSTSTTDVESDYLKVVLGPILVPALAEICTHRPTDPIEYLAQWLIRWRYNQELRKADIRKAVEVVGLKEWTQADFHLQGLPNTSIN
jgi:hypothetical protein